MKLALTALIALAGCQRPAPSTSPPPSDDPPPADPVGEPAGGTECDRDDDCVVSCARPGDCCDQLCGPCEQVWTRAALEAHEAWRGPSCAAASCPVARCARPTEETFARCERGACVLERRPADGG